MACGPQDLVEFTIYIYMGFYTTWRLLSWNEYSIVLGLFTKRPKNLFHHWNSLGCETKE